jgi:hypothetical protein
MQEIKIRKQQQISNARRAMIQLVKHNFEEFQASQFKLANVKLKFILKPL